MNARRRLAWADEGVSPVIGVILMVAVTVVLAASVFITVGEIGAQTTPSAPAFAVTADEATDRLTVHSAENNADWDRLILKADVTGGSFALNVDTAGANPETAITLAGVEVAAAINLMGAGEFLDLCGTASNIRFTLTDQTANQVMSENLFASLAAC